MHFMQSGLHVLLALSSVLPGVIGVPVDNHSGWETSIDNNGPQNGTQKSSNAWIASDDALPQLTGRKNERIDLAKRTNPPTSQDFQTFFQGLSKQQSASMVFWSGVGDPAARDFARSKSRNTLEMLIGDRWAEFQKPIAEGGSKWNSWEDTIAGFWDLAAAACANFATGEVWVYMTKDVMDDQTRPNCPKCWYREEKPRLIEGLNNGRITKITKYSSPSKEAAGDITAMNNKIKRSLLPPRGNFY